MNTRQRVKELLRYLRTQRVALPAEGTPDEALLISEIVLFASEARIEVYEAVLKNRDMEAAQDD